MVFITVPPTLWQSAICALCCVWIRVCVLCVRSSTLSNSNCAFQKYMQTTDRKDSCLCDCICVFCLIIYNTFDKIPPPVKDVDSDRVIRFSPRLLLLVICSYAVMNTHHVDILVSTLTKSWQFCVSRSLLVCSCSVGCWMAAVCHCCCFNIDA